MLRAVIAVIGPRPVAAKVSRRCSQSATYTRPTSTGTSINGPTTPARASPEVAPKTPTETAIASSKLLLGAVNAGAAVWS
jgi:hypothetical protein